MVIHQNDPILPLVGGLNGTNLSTGGIIAVVAHEKNGLFFSTVCFILGPDAHPPNPMNVPAFIVMKSDVVLLPAGIHTLCAARPTLGEIDDHPPPLPNQNTLGLGKLTGAG
jgi:hypothetical protein